MEQDSAATLREAAQYLEELAGPAPEPWHVAAGAVDSRVARIKALHDPQTVFLLADVLFGLADAADDGIEPEPGWLSYAEAVLLKRDNLSGRI